MTISRQARLHRDHVHTGRLAMVCPVPTWWPVTNLAIIDYLPWNQRLGVYDINSIAHDTVNHINRCLIGNNMYYCPYVTSLCTIFLDLSWNVYFEFYHRICITKWMCTITFFNMSMKMQSSLLYNHDIYLSFFCINCTTRTECYITYKYVYRNDNTLASMYVTWKRWVQYWNTFANKFHMHNLHYSDNVLRSTCISIFYKFYF